MGGKREIVDIVCSTDITDNIFGVNTFITVLNIDLEMTLDLKEGKDFLMDILGSQQLGRNQPDHGFCFPQYLLLFEKYIKIKLSYYLTKTPTDKTRAKSTYVEVWFPPGGGLSGHQGAKKKENISSQRGSQHFVFSFSNKTRPLLIQLARDKGHCLLR